MRRRKKSKNKTEIRDERQMESFGAPELANELLKNNPHPSAGRMKGGRKIREQGE